MARPKTVRAPTTASLPNSLRIPSTTPSLVKTLGRLSRQSLLDLALQWLDDKNVQSFPPFLAQDEAERAEDNDDDDEETRPYPAAQTVEEVREVYHEMRDRKGGKREVIDRILEGDWRHGITLRQLAMADIRYIEDHPTSSHKWTALQLTRVGRGSGSKTVTDDKDLSACLPRLHASTFLKNLQREISPLVKAHYHFSRSQSLPLSFLRIFVTNSPYQYPRQSSETFTDSSRVVYVAFPDSCPFIYTSISSSPSTTTTGTKGAAGAATDTRTLRHIVRDAIPKALSRPHERYMLQGTSLTAKSLHALLALRGAGRTNAANGAFSIFADAVVEGSPLDPRPADTVSPEEYRREYTGAGAEGQEEEGQEKEIPTTTSSTDQQQQQQQRHRGTKSRVRPTDLDPDPDPETSKRRKLAVCSRFGTAGTPASAARLDRLDIRLLDPPVEQAEGDVDDDPETRQPTMTLTFSGTDVVAGLRKLAELGIVDPGRMPSWMTGEEGVSVATVRRGRRVVAENPGGG